MTHLQAAKQNLSVKGNFTLADFEVPAFDTNSELHEKCKIIGDSS